MGNLSWTRDDIEWSVRHRYEKILVIYHDTPFWPSLADFFDWFDSLNIERYKNEQQEKS